MTTETTTAHYEGDPLAGAPLAHEFTHCEMVYEIYRAAEGKQVRVKLASLHPGDDGHWAFDAAFDPDGRLRVYRCNGEAPLSPEYLLGLVGRVQGELYDGRSGAVYTVSGPQG